MSTDRLCADGRHGVDVVGDDQAAGAPHCSHRLDASKIAAMYEQDSLLAGCLDPVDRAVLAFARNHPRRCPDAVIRSVLGLSATAYYQRLLALVDRVEAVVVEPVLVERLRAERDRRWHARRGAS